MSRQVDKPLQAKLVHLDGIRFHATCFRWQLEKVFEIGRIEFFRRHELPTIGPVFPSAADAELRPVQRYFRFFGTGSVP
jgi:hypothetical protein